jgi:DNA-binding Lrp family transcriptional regulator
MDFSEMDEVDLEILKLLSSDGRKSFRSIAQDLEKSPVTIKNHVEDLENLGIIDNYGIKIDYEKLGFEIMAFIEVVVSKGKMLDVEKDIAENPNVFGVYDITGTYDAIILARFRSRKHLSEMIKKIHKSQFVERTNTHLILNIIKEGVSFKDLMKHERERDKKEPKEESE